MYDYIIIGAGLTGSIIARMLSEKQNKKVLIVERRDHIAGNAYDFMSEHNIKVQKYGPHVFHTNSKKAYSFITQFCEQIPYRTKCEAVIDDISTPSPFNFKTIDQFYPEAKAKELKSRLKECFNKPYATVLEMLKCEDLEIKEYAKFLFDKDYKLYTAKQWNLMPEQIDPSVLNRVPILFSYRDTYFEDKYEFIPKEGFTGLVENMLNHPNIDIELSTEALVHVEFDEDKKKIHYGGIDVPIIYTGAIDELFNYCFGTLPYRSLYFEFEFHSKNSFQNTAIVAYPQALDYTRITEYTKMPQQKTNGWTVAAYEYPITYDKESEKGNEPYYPVLTADSQSTYKKYEELAATFTNLIPCGRLADFKYYNMDQVVLRALDVYDQIKRGAYGEQI